MADGCRRLGSRVRMVRAQSEAGWEAVTTWETWPNRPSYCYYCKFELASEHALLTAYDHDGDEWIERTGALVHYGDCETAAARMIEYGRRISWSSGMLTS